MAAATMKPPQEQGKIVQMSEFASQLKDFSRITEMAKGAIGFEAFSAWISSKNPSQQQALLLNLNNDLKSGMLAADWRFNNPAAQSVFLKIVGSYENANLYTLGVWLSKQFLYDKYGIKNPNDVPIKQDEEFKRFCYYVAEVHQLFFFPVGMGATSQEAFLRGFKVGLHESTHALLQVRSREKKLLSEFSTGLTNEFAPAFRMGNPMNSIFEKDAQHFGELIGQGKAAQTYEDYMNTSPYLANYAMPWLLAWSKRSGKKFDVFDFVVELEGLEPSKLNMDQLREVVIQDVFRSALRYGSFPHLEKEFADYFCKISGIKDEVLMGKFAELFAELGKSGGWNNEKDFLNKLDAALTKVFGKPKEREYPEDYSENALGSRFFVKRKTA